MIRKDSWRKVHLCHPCPLSLPRFCALGTSCDAPQSPAHWALVRQWVTHRLSSLQRGPKEAKLDPKKRIFSCVRGLRDCSLPQHSVTTLHSSP